MTPPKKTLPTLFVVFLSLDALKVKDIKNIKMNKFFW